MATLVTNRATGDTVSATDVNGICTQVNQNGSDIATNATNLAAKMAANALANMRMTYTAGNALSSRPALPTGVPVTLYNATSTQASAPPSWFIDGDEILIAST